VWQCSSAAERGALQLVNFGPATVLCAMAASVVTENDRTAYRERGVCVHYSSTHVR
jgi:hypothetical protein